MATAFCCVIYVTSWSAGRVLLATHPFHVGLIDGFCCLVRGKDLVRAPRVFLLTRGGAESIIPLLPSQRITGSGRCGSDRPYMLFFNWNWKTVRKRKLLPLPIALQQGPICDLCFLSSRTLRCSKLYL